jgi:hypothetical protein
MIFLYTLLLLLLGVTRFVVMRRAGALERKFTRMALAADKLAREPFKPGNGNKWEVCQAAKRQYQLGILVQKRDRLEARHHFWDALADKLTRWKTALSNWKGKKLPYTLGVVDVALVLYALDRLGLGEYTSPEALWELAASLISK